jgi:hypothetical protein
MRNECVSRLAWKWSWTDVWKWFWWIPLAVVIHYGTGTDGLTYTAEY